MVICYKTLRVDCSQMLHIYWKSSLCIEIRMIPQQVHLDIFYYNLLLSNIPATKPATLTFFVLTLYHNVYHHVHSLICDFLGFVKLSLCLHCILYSFRWFLCLVFLKGFSAIEQLLYIFLFILSSILLYMGFCLVSILSIFRGKESFSTQCSILPSLFS